MAFKSWVSLHTHSTFSFKDGYAMPEAHAERAAGLGMSALGITEHGNVSSHARHEQACAKAGIKAVFGLEAYTAAAGYIENKIRYKWHLGIIAMDNQGYANLMSMVTESWHPEVFYHEPTVTGESLAVHSDGIAVLSGCTGSKLACDLVGGKGREEHPPDIRAATATAAAFRDLLGDRYYLEVQAFPGLDKTRAINSAYEHIGRSLGIPLVATCDIHYPYPDDNSMHTLLHATGRGGKTMDQQQQTWEYDILMTYPQSEENLWTDLRHTGLSRKAATAAIENAGELADRCDVTLPKAPKLVYPIAEEDLEPWH